MIVCESADTTEMIPKLIKGVLSFRTSMCFRSTYFCLRGKGKKVAEDIASGASKLKVGNAIEEQTECGLLFAQERSNVWNNG